MNYVEEKGIHRYTKPVFEISLSIYSVAVCGEDLQKGSPFKVSAKGEDLYELKMRTSELILSVVPKSSKCFVEGLVTKDDKYYDRDEWWVEVDVLNKTVECVGE